MSKPRGRDRRDDDLAPDDFGVVEPVGRARPGRPARRATRFAAVLTALAVLVVGAVLVGVYPTRTWLRQQRAVHASQHDLAVLRQQNQALQEEATRLQDPAEIERIARAEYNLVRPGEEAYAIIPGGPSSTVPIPMMTVIEPDGRVHEVPSTTTPGYVARDPAAATGAASETPTSGPPTESPTSEAPTTTTTTPTGGG